MTKLRRDPPSSLVVFQACRVRSPVSLLAKLSTFRSLSALATTSKPLEHPHLFLLALHSTFSPQRTRLPQGTPALPEGIWASTCRSISTSPAPNQAPNLDAAATLRHCIYRVYRTKTRRAGFSSLFGAPESSIRVELYALSALPTRLAESKRVLVYVLVANFLACRLFTTTSISPSINTTTHTIGGIT